jgi:hypothetical protein
MKARQVCLSAFILSLFSFSVAAQAVTEITGTLDWETMAINAKITLNIKRAGINLPGGRAQAEETLLSDYVRLARPVLLSLPVDSGGTLYSLLRSGEISTSVIDNMALSGARIPPAFSPDLLYLTASRTINLKAIAPILVAKLSPREIPQPLQPAPSPPATGILIIADGELPIHGKNASSLVQPCLFPKIWDSDMNLVYSRDMVEKDPAGKQFSMVQYTTSDKVFLTSPSGIDDTLAAVIGENPLRIIATGVFGISPTDIIIDPDDALIILSGPQTRDALLHGKVAIVLNKQVLVTEIGSGQ